MTSTFPKGHEMTTTVLSVNTASTFVFAAEFDQLVLSTGVAIVNTTSVAIETSFGFANVVVDGSAYGTMGFFDSSTSGGDIVAVGQAGSLVGVGGDGIDIKGNGSDITNAGRIDGTESDGIQCGQDTTVINQGAIEGYFDAIVGAGHDAINNSGTMSSLAIQRQTIYESSGDDTIFNSGMITSSSQSAGIFLNGSSNSVTNTGTIGGGFYGIFMTGGSNTVTNSGTISGLNIAIGFGGNDGGASIRNTGLIEGVGFDAVAIEFSNSGAVAVSNLGTILGLVVFDGSDATMNNSGAIDGEIAFFGDNNTYLGGHGETDGIIDCSGSHGLYTGGADGTTFSIAASQLASTDTITGGASTYDTLDITGAGAVSLSALKNVSGFETLSLAASESIVIRGTLADTAAGNALTIDTSGFDLVNLASVTSTTDAITIWGAAGDVITAGASRDTFGFGAASASTGSGYDLIAGVNFAHDRFDVTTNIDAVTGINTAVTSGTLSNASFNTDLAADLGSTKLSADHAVLFTASAGQLIGDRFLVVDLNGTAGYQANSVLVIRLTGATGTWTTANFI